MSDLPGRPGVRPKTSASGPHRQLSQQSRPATWGHTAAAIFALQGVIEGHSSVCPPSSRAVLLDGLPTARVAETSLAPQEDSLEPVHLHGVFDTSLHLCLPVRRARDVCALGWGEPHRYVGHGTEIMVYGPRDREELLVVMQLVGESIAFARS